jgi:hypothetical protein
MFSKGEVDIFSFCRALWRCIPYNLQDDFHHGGHVRHTGSFFLTSLVCQVVTCTFDSSLFEVAIIFGVPISSTVCTYLRQCAH